MELTGTLVVNGREDVPKFLEGTIDIVYDLIMFVCSEGVGRCGLGATLGYEQTNNTRTGWQCWCIEGEIPA